MRRFVFLALLSSALQPSIAAAEAPSPPAERLALIVDSSGSMKARLGKEPRIDIAKRVVSELIAGLPGGLDVGLWAYGHRRKDDCADVEELAPIGPLDREAVGRRVKGLRPLGMTPITSSVQKVAATLQPGAAHNTTIVLVSDGEETCHADPCALVRTLRQKGLRFVLHVVGFAVGPKERAQLECIAREGGGRYFSADSAKGLGDAFGEVLAKPELRGGTIAVRALRQGQPIRVEYRITVAGRGGSVGMGWTSERGPVAVPVLPGTYVVAVHDSGVSPPQRAERGGVCVEGSATTAVDLELAGFGTLQLLATREGTPLRIEYSIRGLDGKGASRGWTSAQGALPVTLQSGSYEVAVHDGTIHPEQRVQAPIAVAANGVSPLELKLDPIGTVSVLVTRGGAPARVEYALTAANGGNAARGYTSDQGPLLLPAQVGSYRLTIRYEVAGKTRNGALPGIVVRAHETAEARLEAQ